MGDNLAKNKKENFFRAQIKCQTPFDIDAFTNEQKSTTIEFPSSSRCLFLLSKF